MSEDSSVGASIISLLLTWAPMLLLIGVFVFYARPRRGELRNTQYLALCLEEQKRHNQFLEKILDRIVPASSRHDMTESG